MPAGSGEILRTTNTHHLSPNTQHLQDIFHYSFFIFYPINAILCFFCINTLVVMIKSHNFAAG